MCCQVRWAAARFRRSFSSAPNLWFLAELGISALFALPWIPCGAPSVQVLLIALHTSPHLPSELNATNKGVDLAQPQPEGFRTRFAVALAGQEAAELSDQAHPGVERARLGGGAYCG